MAHFAIEALPNELLAQVISFLDRRSLAQVRLVSTRLEQISVKQLFAKIALSAHWKKKTPALEKALRQRRDSSGFPSGHYADFLFEPIENRSQEAESLSSEDPWLDQWYNTPAAPRAEEEWPLESGRSKARNEEIGPSSGNPDPPHDYESTEDDPSWMISGQRRRPPTPNPMPPWAFDGVSGSSYTAQMFKNILDNPSLRQLVKGVHIYTCNTDCDLHPMFANKWYGDGNQYRPEYNAIYLECVQRIGEFPNIRSIAVYFDRHSSGTYYDVAEDLLQNSKFKSWWLDRILCQVDARKITEFGVRHYDNTVETENSLSLFVKRAVNLTSLRLHIVHEHVYPNASSTLLEGNIHPFWRIFPDQLLEPKQQNLTTLVLYSDVPLGLFPRLDLRKIHFAQLRSLTLGQHIFYHDDQINWIISHGSTLEELNLDHCSILYSIEHSKADWLDEDGYPRQDHHPYFKEASSWDELQPRLLFSPIYLRWHDIFLRFQELHALQEFRFGSSKQWNFHTLSRHFQRNGGEGHPVMPWEDEKNIENKILNSRYLPCDEFGAIYRREWLWQAGRYHYDSIADDIWRKQLKIEFDNYPDCKEADQVALQALLDNIGQ